MSSNDVPISQAAHEFKASRQSSGPCGGQDSLEGYAAFMCNFGRCMKKIPLESYYSFFRSKRSFAAFALPKLHKERS